MFKSGRIAPLLVLAAALLGGCRSEIQLTKAPPLGANPATASTATTAAVRLAFPLDLEPVRAHVDAALPAEVARIVEWVGDAACLKRTKWVACNAAKAEGEVTRAGKPSLAIDGRGRLGIVIPLAYRLSARGVGWASSVGEERRGTLNVTMPYAAFAAAGHAPDVRLADELEWSETEVQVLKGRMRIVGWIDSKLRTHLNGTADVIRKTVRTRASAEAVQQAWRLLHQPVAISRSPFAWHRSQPERLIAVGFAADPEGPSWRLEAEVALSPAGANRPPIGGIRPLPDPGRAPLPGASGAADAGLSLVVVVPYERLRASVSQVLAAADVLESKADPYASPLLVRVRSAEVFPSGGHIGAELGLDIVGPANWAGFKARAFILGQPAVTSDARRITAAGFRLPHQTAKEQREAMKAIRIGAEPFGSLLSEAMTLDIGPELDRLQADLARGIDGWSGEGVAVAGRFGRIAIQGVTPGRDGLLVRVALEGSLGLRIDGRWPLASVLVPPQKAKQVAGEGPASPVQRR